MIPNQDTGRVLGLVHLPVWNFDEKTSSPRLGSTNRLVLPALFPDLEEAFEHYILGLTWPS